MNQEPRLAHVLRDDLRSGELLRNLRRDFAEVKDFYLDQERRKRLQQMRRVKRWLYAAGWLLKALILKLSPTRRVLVAIGLLLFLFSHTVHIEGKNVWVSSDSSFSSVLVLLFVLALELKDKLIARSELEEGRAIQTALMPERTPSVPGWSLWLYTRTANDVGGDLIDFQKINSEKFAISLTDVAGKGLKAALLMAKIQATLRAIAPDRKTVAELGSRMNRIFYRDTIRTMFASLVYMEISPDSDTVEFFNAGHMPPLLLQRSEVRELGKGDPAIGIFPELSISTQKCPLAKDDCLIVYSDGLTDAKNSYGEFFGAQRLIHLLHRLTGMNAESMGGLITAEIARFTGETPLYDDLSLAIVKRTE